MLMLPESLALTAFSGVLRLGPPGLRAAAPLVRVRVVCPDGPTHLGPGARVEIDAALATALHDQPGLVQRILTQSHDLPGFLADMRHALDNLALVAIDDPQPHHEPPAHLPPAAYYRTLLAQLAELGWHCVHDIDHTMARIAVKVVDRAQRIHIARLALPLDYPRSPPVCQLNLPATHPKLPWASGDTLASVMIYCEANVDAFQPFFSAMDDLDAATWVLDPENPGPADICRRIAIDTHVSLWLQVDPHKPTAIPEFRFIGPDALTSPLRTKLAAHLPRWDQAKHVRQNLLDALGMGSLPLQPSGQGADDAQSAMECGICYSYRVESMGVPDTSCDFVNCSRSFHRECLRDWLFALPDSKQSFDVIHGQCPYCFNPLSVACGHD